jgi:microcystin-dependent protein
MSLPSNSYYPLFPIQETIFDSITGLALADGSVYFYRQNAPSVMKDVYQRTLNPDNTFTYAVLPNPLVLSAIGTFVDDNGNNIIPFLWPFVGSPSATPPSTDVDLYYIAVVASGGSEDSPEFTVDAWPPEVSGGSSTSDNFISSDNVISNPQFAVINYPSPYTFTVSGTATNQIAPDWNIITTGAGTVTINQVAVTDTAVPGLPAFALNITSSGITALLLSQTIAMSPRILENGYASGTFVVESQTSLSPTITMNFVPSNPALTSLEVVSGSAVEGGYTAYYGNVDLSSLTKNPDSGSVGYVNIQISIPVSANINISCIQLLSVPDDATLPVYIQETTPRQIDHLYHDAYPIVPVGTVIDFGGFAAHAHYLLGNGAAYSRVTYNQLYRAMTLIQSITELSTTTFTVTSAAQLGLGMFVEGTGILVGTYITVNQATTSTGTFSATFYAAGQGDGSTTFNVYNLAGIVIAGAGGNLIALSPLLDTLGQSGGASTATLAINNMPAHNHSTPTASTAPISSLGISGPSAGSSMFMVAGGSTTVSVGSQGSGTPFGIVQATTILYKYIRYE